MKNFYVYILTNKNNKVLYMGVTNNIIRRLAEHKARTASGFTKKYNVNKLVYVEQFNNPYDAIAREKQIKAGPRKKKIALIRDGNPLWLDLIHYLF